MFNSFINFKTIYNFLHGKPYWNFQKTNENHAIAVCRKNIKLLASQSSYILKEIIDFWFVSFE